MCVHVLFRYVIYGTTLIRERRLVCVRPLRTHDTQRLLDDICIRMKIRDLN